MQVLWDIQFIDSIFLPFSSQRASWIVEFEENLYQQIQADGSIRFEFILSR